MNRFDWQAYVDGTLGPDERARHETRLAQDEIARREVEGLRSLKREVRKAALSEPVPKATLLAILKRAQRHPMTVPSRIAVAACLTMALLVGAYVFNQSDPVKLDRSPVTEEFATSNAIVAAQWVTEQTGLPAPIMKMRCGAKIRAAKYGDGWAGYQFEHDGRRFRLFMSRCNKPFDGARVVTKAGKEFYVGKGIGWKQNGIAYYLRGGDESTRWSMAMECVASIESQRTRGL